MKQRDIVKRINELISEDGYTAYSKLPDYLQNELVAIWMQSEDCEYDLNTSEIIDNLIDYLLSDTPESADDLARSLSKSAIANYENEISILFDEQYAYYESEVNKENGLHPIVDRTNGETRWIK